MSRRADNTAAAAGLTVLDIAKRFRVGASKVRAWIARGELPAINTADAACGRPRWVVTADGLAAFEQRRAGSPQPKAARRARQTARFTDYYAA